MPMLDKINAIKQEIISVHPDTSEQLESFRLLFLSKKGKISSLFEDFKTVPHEQKKQVGEHLNALKNFAGEQYETFKRKLSSDQTGSLSDDLTQSSFPFLSGCRHPVSLVRKEITDNFF